MRISDWSSDVCSSDLLFLTFFGKARWAASEHVQHALHGHEEQSGSESPAHEHDGHAIAVGTGGYHPHESPWNMLIPLGDRKSTRLNSSHSCAARMPSSA